MESGPGTIRSSRRVMTIAAAAAGVAALWMLAMLVSNGSTSNAIAANARSLHWVNSILGSAALARAASAQAVVFAVDHDLAVASDTALAAAVKEARIAFDYLEEQIGLRPADDVDFDPDLDAAISRLFVISSQVLSGIESGNTAEAVRISQGNFEVLYQRLALILVSEQTRILGQIDETESALGRVGEIANVVATLLIPGAAIAIYFLLARRQVRERTRLVEVQLEAARRLAAAKSEFIAGLSHELRTPLTSIYGFSEVLLGAGVVDPKQSTDLIRIINTESSELMRMVEDILAGARLDAGALTFESTNVEVNREIETVVEPFRRAGLEIALACPPVTITADRMRLRQILRKLVSNAQKHGGPRIAIGTQIRGRELVLAVVDDGPGVPREIESRLFERYVHDGRRAILTGSVGLGLAIARTLAETMKGRLKYERIDGCTVFSLSLPIAAPPEPRPGEWLEESGKYSSLQTVNNGDHR
ncbi:hypothetical protein BH18ACT5_BH18ACT5_12540 [soil metagenome]